MWESYSHIKRRYPKISLSEERCLILKAQKGSKESNRNKVGKVTWSQVEAIAKDKMPDLNCFTIESAMKMVAGTARSMGVIIKGKAPWEN